MLNEHIFQFVDWYNTKLNSINVCLLLADTFLFNSFDTLRKHVAFGDKVLKGRQPLRFFSIGSKARLAAPHGSKYLKML